MKKLLPILIILTTAYCFIDCTDIHGSCYNGPHRTNVGSIYTCGVPGTIAMTFDDGPSNYTMYISNKLHDYGIRGTFFTEGKKFNMSGYILRYLLKQNHQIACHTYSHPDLTTLTPQNITDEIMEYEKRFVALNIFNNSRVPKYIRVPYSRINKNVSKVLTNLGYIVVDFTIDSNDTLSLDTLKNYKESFGGEDSSNVSYLSLSVISIHHDTTFATFSTIDTLLKWLNINFIQKGTHFVTVAECLDDVNPYKRMFVLDTGTKSDATMNNISLYLINIFMVIHYFFSKI